MILNQISLENFVSHKKTDLDLGYGINVIIGPNGAGKSSILDGVNFALFNDSSSRGKKDNLINSRAKKGKVHLAFAEGGVNYSAEWILERKGAARGSLYRIDVKKTLLVQGGERAVVPEIEKILGLDKNKFMQSVYVKQGDIEKLVTARPGERKELISRLLGIEDLERAWSGMKDLIQTYIDKQTALRVELDRKPKVEKQKTELGDKIKDQREKLVKDKINQCKLAEKVAEIKNELEAYRVKKEKFDEVTQEIGKIEQSVTNTEDKLQSEQNELNKALAAQELVKSLESDISKFPLLETFYHGVIEKEAQQTKLNVLQDKIDEFIRLSAVLQNNDEDYKAYIIQEQEIVKKLKQRKSLEGANSSLQNTVNQLESLEKTKNTKNNALLKELEKHSKVLGKQVTANTIQAIHEFVRNELTSKISQIDSVIEEISKKINGLQQKKEELDENLDKFSGDSKAKTCPTCQTELTPERIEQLVNEYSAELKECKPAIRKLKSELAAAKEEKDRAVTLKSQVDGIDPERVHSLATELTEITDQIEDKKSEMREFKKQADALQALDSELSKLEEEKASKEEACREYDSAKRQLSKMPQQEDLELKIMPIKNRLKEISELLNASVKALGYEPREPQKELKALQKKKESYDQNLALANRKTELEANVTRISKNLSNCKDEHSKVLQALQTLGYDRDEHRKLEDYFEQENKGLGDLKIEIARQEQALKGLDDELKKVIDELCGLEEKTFEKKKVDNYIGTLQNIRYAYGKDGIQKLIRARARPLLEKTTRDLFERFNLSYSDIKIDDDYNISVIGPLGEQDIDQISGGERVALAIALRLAIAQVLSGRIETIIMDEPTTHLDEERRKELVNILDSFFREGGRIIPQMIIITHHSEIEEVADTIYSVKKIDGYSIVEQGKLST